MKSSTATETTATAEYHGRFAPSPSGPLHLGSLRTALASWLDARAAGGRWSVRIEDIDRSRSDPRHADAILHSLDCLGLTWDGPVWRQSARAGAYQHALGQLARQGLLYPCTCTRRERQALVGAQGEPVYDGRCRDRPAHPGRAAGLRFRVPAGTLTVTDRLQHALTQDLERECGDVLVRRRDGDYGYPLAVVVDDAEQGITDVVRGADLWHQTPVQVALQRALGLPTPRYLHLPLVTDADGAKLSKSRHALPLQLTRPAEPLSWALSSLGFSLPPGAGTARPGELLDWATSRWPEAAVDTSPVAAPA